MRQCNTQYCENEVTRISNLKCDICIVNLTKIKPVVLMYCKSCGHGSKDGVHQCSGISIKGGAIGKQVGGNHYKKHTIQPWHIIDDYNLDFYLGNAIKYILRDKGNRVEDLEKSIHYLERKIEILKLQEEKEHTGSLFDRLDDDKEDTVRD